ncbi:MAG: hypothetical protein HY819_13230 [Acidobacteria bacterium]|nr:hypothetical protein [Acidobacteriota bacterium]
MPTLKTLKNLLKKIYFNIKYYRPTVFRVIALTLSVVLSISSVALIGYIQNLPKTPLERLTQIVFDNTNLVESRLKIIKRLRVEQKNPSYLLSVIRDFIPSDIRLHSFEEYNDKVTFIGTSPLVETVNTFAKDLDFSRGLFTDVNLDLRAISEDEFYFKITCTYNKPVPADYLENETISNDENSTYSEPRQIIVKNIPVTEERKLEFLEKRLKDSYEELSALNEILPEYLKIGQAVHDITRKANFHNVTVTNFKEYEPWQRDSYKRTDSILNIVGDYNSPSCDHS